MRDQLHHRIISLDNLNERMPMKLRCFFFSAYTNPCLTGMSWKKDFLQMVNVLYLFLLQVAFPDRLSLEFEAMPEWLRMRYK